jgi:hypothetical protein
MSAAKVAPASGPGLRNFFMNRIEEMEITIRDKTQNLRRLEAQRNDLNTKGEHWVARKGPIGHPGTVYFRAFVRADSDPPL